MTATLRAIVAAPLARLTETVNHLTATAIQETVRELRAAALASSSSKDVNAARLAVGVLCTALQWTLEQLEGVQAEITDHLSKCLEREGANEKGTKPS